MDHLYRIRRVCDVCTEPKIKEENRVVDSAAPEVVSNAYKLAAPSGTTFVYRKDNTAAALPPSAAMMYSYATPANNASYNPLIKSPCFANPDRSTSGYPPVYGEDVANRMYFSSSVTSSITSLADAYLMQATLPHLQQQQQQQQGQEQRRAYNISLMGSSKVVDPGQFIPSPAGGVGTTAGREHGPSSGHLQLSQQPAGLVDSASSAHQFLPSITEFGSVARHGYC